MPRLDTVLLNVRDPGALATFYRDSLGMRDLGEGRVGYGDGQAALQFARAGTAYAPQPTDLYWKIALSVPNIELAADQLRRRGVAVSDPVQFRDVGYLAKLTDPEGFTVELIDHWFRGERPETPQDETLLGGGAHLSLVTLRCADITEIEPDLLRGGMASLSVQPVTPYGFTLYFYAFTGERPPEPDLQAIENRCWVYQRPYTVLELQHVHALDAVTEPAEGQGGYGGLIVSPDGAEGPGLTLPRLRLTTGASRNACL